MKSIIKFAGAGIADFTLTHYLIHIQVWSVTTFVVVLIEIQGQP
jgi:hypothetical protein